VSRLLAIAQAALEGGASIVQFRDKGVYTPDERSEAALGVRKACNRAAVPFLVNDDPELARRFRADGVHLGRQDPPPTVARLFLGPDAVVGATVYGQPGEEEAAANAGADYLAAGPFFPSPTKPEEPVLPISILDAIIQRSRLPVFAIGGITAETAGLLARHGAAGVAVVSAIMDAEDPKAATADILREFEAGKQG
jgi:thiamine-phosphate pyrophosphorylase